MTKKRMVLEIGMGTDIRGADPTKAACRALRDALWHNSLSIATALGQPLDAYEWLLFVSAHSERHTKQILEVEADPNFPKKRGTI